MENFVPIALFLSLAFVTVAVTRIVADNRTRRKLIEAGATPEQVQAIVTAPNRWDAGRADALKWGLVVGSVGLALIVVQFIPFRPEEPVSIGLILLFGAGGLLAYYGATRRPAGA